ncbi:Golgi complex component 7-domain-containing protein [Sparassis latifolia]
MPSYDTAKQSEVLSPSDLLGSLENYTDVVSWINDIIDTGDAADETQPIKLMDLDQRVSRLVGTLEIASEDTSAQVERIIEEISRGASRLIHDLHFMREGALSLQGLLQEVDSKSKASSDAETSAALDRLHFLDTVRKNMEAARAVLREAESWGSLESDVTSLLSEKNYEKAAERLSEASKSMVVFANTPEYESRRTLMVSLQNQLEAALSSALVAAVTSQDVAVCRNYFAIFRNIQREAEFRNYYYGSRRGPLMETWQGARLRDCDGTAPADNNTLAFSAFLTSFYTAFLSILQTERTSIPAIFPDPQPTLSALITSTLSALQPSFSERLSALATYYGPATLTQLIAAFRATEEFGVTAEKIFEKIGYSAILANSDNSSQPRTRLRRRSSVRMSMSMSQRPGSHRGSISGVVPTEAVPAVTIPVLEWDQELFAPFADFQADYGLLERRFLDDVLANAMRTAPRASSDRARILRERSVDVFGAAEDALGRYAAFTHGYGAEGLLQAVDHLVSAFADASRAEISGRRGAFGTSGSLTPSLSGEDFSDMDYAAEDWAEIQALLHLLEAVRALQDRTLAFETKLRSSLIQVSGTLRAARTEPGTLQISGTTRGAMQLLAQSSLNSASLHVLLDSVDPESASQPQFRSDALLAPTPPSPDPRRSSYALPLPSPPASAPPLLNGARTAIAELAKACQVALQDTILSPLHKHLASYASSPLWSSASDTRPKRATTGSAVSEVQVPTFSRSSSETIQRVAEGLLNLPRLFEVYADDDALAFSLSTLPHIGPVFLRALAEPVPQEPSGSPSMQHTRRSPSLALQKNPLVAAPAQASLRFLPEAVTAVWLASLGRTLLAHLTSDVLPSIRMLTPAGAAQLAADLGYLGNIAEALNVEWLPLSRWRMFVEMEDADGRKKTKDSGKSQVGDKVRDGEKVAEETDDEDDEGESEDQVLATVAKLRGWPM